MTDILTLDHQAKAGAFATEAPQSWEEVRPIVQALRQQLDPRLDVVWHPRAFLARPNVVDAYGNSLPQRAEGRWLVVIPGKLDGKLTIIHTIGAEMGPHCPYRAVGWWLLDFLRACDSANREAMQAQRDRMEAHDRLQIAAEQYRQERTEDNTARFAADVLKDRKYPGIGADFSTEIH